MITWLTIGACIVIGALGWNLYRRLGADRIETFNERRRPGSRLVSRGELIDGNRTVPVALAVTRSTFLYENSDIQGSLDLRWVQEIEYDSGVATGARIRNGSVLRLRAHSQTFEFLLPPEVAASWQTTLPARRLIDHPGAEPVQS